MAERYRAYRPEFSGNYPMEARRALIEAQGVTLDGERAKVVGARLDFAVVSAFPSGRRAEFAWPTVARVVAAGGAFQS